MGEKSSNLELTTNEKKALRFIRSFSNRFGVLPSYRILGEKLSVYPNAARYLTLQLVKKGHVAEEQLPKPPLRKAKR